MKTKIIPLQDTLYIEAIEDKESSSGIVRADVAIERPNKGKVIYASEGYVDENGTDRAMTVRVGDTVIFNRYAYEDVEIDGKKLLQMSQKDIYAILKQYE